MSFRFRTAVIYERAQIFAKDIYNLTNKFPEFEKDGLIREIRSCCTLLVRQTAEVLNKPKGQEETKEAYKLCLGTISHIVALFDFALSLEYIPATLHDRAIQLSEDTTKYLYEDKESRSK